MTNKAHAVIIITLGATLLTARAQTAQTPAAAAPPPTLSATEQMIKDIKNPTSWLSWGGDFRIRNEYFDNALTLGSAYPRHSQDYFRLRRRVWATITPAENLTVNTRVSAEPRDFMEPSFPGTYLDREGMEWRYGILDVANLKLANVLDQPLTVTLGRQDVMDVLNMRNGWLVFDGTPSDGSWTFFVDGARAVYDAKDIKTKFDVSYVSMHAYADEVIPTIGNSSSFSPAGRYTGYTLTEQDEQGTVLSIGNTSIENVNLGGFFIYKNDTRVRGVANGDNADIYTFGGSISGTPSKHWQYWIEGAYQCGSKEDPTVSGADSGWRTINAYGANARLTYLFNDRLNNQLALVGEFLSGDDSGSAGTDEMFDVLWARWPRWSEMYIYSYANETSGKVAQMNNVGRFGPMWTISPMKGMTFSAMYNALFAPESVPTRAMTPGRFSQDGNFRGHYLQAVLKHKFSDHLSGHLWAEWVWEGDYYKDQDIMSWLRAEILMTF